MAWRTRLQVLQIVIRITPDESQIAGEGGPESPGEGGMKRGGRGAPSNGQAQVVMLNQEDCGI